MARAPKPDGTKKSSRGGVAGSKPVNLIPNYTSRTAALFRVKPVTYSKEILDLVDGMVGDYAFPGNGQPSVYMRVREVGTSHGLTPVVSIVSVMSGHYLHGKAFDYTAYLICGWASRPNFKPVLNNTLGADTQQMLHDFLYPLYAAASLPTAQPQLWLAGGTDLDHHKMGAKEAGKLATRQARAASDALALIEVNQRESYKAQCAQVGLHHMRTQTITVRQAVSGRVGYVDMSDQSGDLMIQVTRANSDPDVKVMQMIVSHVSTHHTLSAQGVRVGDSIGSGHLMSGNYGQIDVGFGGVSLDRAAIKDILIRYIQTQLKSVGIRIGSNHSPSRRAAAA